MALRAQHERWIFKMRGAAAMLFALTWPSISGASSCPSYAGREWELTGHLINRIYPGPPDYESVTSGDQPIVRWYLQLAWPACFDEYRYQTRFQLALKPEEVDRYSQFLGKQISVKGTLAQGVPGRDTTSLVVNVSSLVQFSTRDHY
jgi:hypothetical protein